MKIKDWAIIGGYVIGVLSALDSPQAGPAIDAVLGVFGIKPGVGAQVDVIAGALLTLGTLVYAHVTNTQAIKLAAQSGPSSAPDTSAQKGPQ